MKDIQKKVDDWAQTLETPYWKPLEILARLTEEVGELARELNIRFGAKKKKSTDETKDIEDEIGDIIFTLACLGNSLSLDLEKGVENALQKPLSRDKGLHKSK